MSLREKELYEFGDFYLDVSEHRLARRSGESVQLSEKTFDTLCVLVRNAGHLVKKTELLDQVWPESFVEENNLNKCIHALRRALGENPGMRFVETVQKHGYRFVADVKRVEPLAEGVLRANEDSILSATYLSRARDSADLAERRVFDRLSPPATAEDGHPEMSVTATEAVSPEAPTSVSRSTLILKLAAISVILLASVGLGLYLYSEYFSNAVRTGGKRSFAVLPVRPLNAADRDDVYDYEIGIAEAVIHQLNSLKGFTVRPISSTRQYSDIAQDPIAAGREQKVDYVLASNYQIADGRIRVTSQLLNVATGETDLTYKGEKPVADLFAMQDAIAVEIGSLLKERFSTTRNRPTAKRGTDNEEAYRLYLHGAALADKQHHTEVFKAIECFEKAIQLDPNYALAYARLANAQSTVVGNRSGAAGEQYPKAKAAIEKALAIDDTLAEAHSYLAEIKSDFERDFAGAEREHKRALELDPNSPIAHRMYSLFLTYLGRHDESLSEIKTAIDLEPASVLNQLLLGRSLLFARRYDEAVTHLERAAEMDPEFLYPHQSLVIAYRMKGDNDKAFESFLRSRIIAGEEQSELHGWRSTYALSGWDGIFERQLEKAKVQERNGKPNYNLLANLSSELGRREEAFAYLEKALVQHGGLTYLKVHPRFDSLRSDPRFDDLVKRAGFE